MQIIANILTSLYVSPLLGDTNLTNSLKRDINSSKRFKYFPQYETIRIQYITALQN